MLFRRAEHIVPNETIVLYGRLYTVLETTKVESFIALELDVNTEALANAGKVKKRLLLYADDLVEIIT